MGTLMDKLNATNASKEQIRQAIERKKVSVPAETPLKDYPAKIDGIYPDALFLETKDYEPMFRSLPYPPTGFNEIVDLCITDKYVAYAGYDSNTVKFKLVKFENGMWNDSKEVVVGHHGEDYADIEMDCNKNGFLIAYRARRINLVGTSTYVYHSVDGATWKSVYTEKDGFNNGDGFAVGKNFIKDGFCVCSLDYGNNNSTRNTYYFRFLMSYNGVDWIIKESPAITNSNGEGIFYEEQAKLFIREKYTSYSTYFYVARNIDDLKEGNVNSWISSSPLNTTISGYNRRKLISLIGDKYVILWEEDPSSDSNNETYCAFVSNKPYELTDMKKVTGLSKDLIQQGIQYNEFLNVFYKYIYTYDGKYKNHTMTFRISYDLKEYIDITIKTKLDGGFSYGDEKLPIKINNYIYLPLVLSNSNTPNVYLFHTANFVSFDEDLKKVTNVYDTKGNDKTLKTHMALNNTSTQNAQIGIALLDAAYEAGVNSI